MKSIILSLLFLSVLPSSSWANDKERPESSFFAPLPKSFKMVFHNEAMERSRAIKDQPRWGEMFLEASVKYDDNEWRDSSFRQLLVTSIRSVSIDFLIRFQKKNPEFNTKLKICSRFLETSDYIRLGLSTSAPSMSPPKPPEWSDFKQKGFIAELRAWPDEKKVKFAAHFTKELSSLYKSYLDTDHFRDLVHYLTLTKVDGKELVAPSKVAQHLCSGGNYWLDFKSETVAEFFLGNPSVLLSCIDQAPQRDLESAAKYMLSRPEFSTATHAIWRVLWVAKGEAYDQTILRKLVRYSIQGKGLIQNVLNQLASIIKDEDRRKKMYELAKLLTVEAERPLSLVAVDSNGLQSFLSNTSKPLPDGYVMVKERVGQGKVGVVHKVRRLSDGKFFAWKVPTNDSKEVKEALLSEVKHVEEWVKVGATDMEVFFDKASGTLFKSFVDGRTLREIAVESNGAVFVNRNSPINQDLKFFLLSMLIQKSFVKGLNADNLIYSESERKWRAIDGAGVETFYSYSYGFDLLRDSLTSKWARKPHMESYADQVKVFWKDFAVDFKDLTDEKTETKKKAEGKEKPAKGYKPISYSSDGPIDWGRCEEAYFDDERKWEY